MFSYTSFIVSILRVFNPFLVDCFVFKSLKQSPGFTPLLLKESLRCSFCLSLEQLEGCRKNGIHRDFSTNPVLHTYFHHVLSLMGMCEKTTQTVTRESGTLGPP